VGQILSYQRNGEDRKYFSFFSAITMLLEEGCLSPYRFSKKLKSSKPFPDGVPGDAE